MSTVTLVIALGHRLALFAVLQGILTIIFAAGGSAEPLLAAGAWWPVTAIGVNVVSLVLMRWWLHCAGERLRDQYRIIPDGWQRSIAEAALIALIGVLLALGGALGLGLLLFGDPSAAVDALVQPLPAWAVIPVVVFFPITTALVELPLYFGIVLPQLRARGLGTVAAVAITGGALALQHAALPLSTDLVFVLWRALMFLAFALVIGAAIARRRELLPYLIAVHLAVDLVVAVQIAQASGR